MKESEKKKKKKTNKKEEQWRHWIGNYPVRIGSCASACLRIPTQLKYTALTVRTRLDDPRISFRLCTLFLRSCWTEIGIMRCTVYGCMACISLRTETQSGNADKGAYGLGGFMHSPDRLDIKHKMHVAAPLCSFFFFFFSRDALFPSLCRSSECHCVSAHTLWWVPLARPLLPTFPLCGVGGGVRDRRCHVYLQFKLNFFPFLKSVHPTPDVCFGTLPSRCLCGTWCTHQKSNDTHWSRWVLFLGSCVIAVTYGRSTLISVIARSRGVINNLRGAHTFRRCHSRLSCGADNTGHPHRELTVFPAPGPKETRRN